MQEIFVGWGPSADFVLGLWNQLLVSVIQAQLSLYKITESNFLADEKGSALGKVDVWIIDLLILIHLLTFTTAAHDQSWFKEKLSETYKKLYIRGAVSGIF